MTFFRHQEINILYYVIHSSNFLVSKSHNIYTSSSSINIQGLNGPEEFANGGIQTRLPKMYIASVLDYNVSMVCENVKFNESFMVQNYVFKLW